MPSLRPFFYFFAGLVAVYFLIAHPQPAQAQRGRSTSSPVYDLKLVFYVKYQQIFPNKKPAEYPNYSVRVTLIDQQGTQFSCNTTPNVSIRRTAFNSDRPSESTLPTNLKPPTAEVLERANRDGQSPWGLCVIDPQKKVRSAGGLAGNYVFALTDTKKTYIPIQSLFYSDDNRRIYTKCPYKKPPFNLPLRWDKQGSFNEAPLDYGCRIGSWGYQIPSYGSGATETTGSGGGSASGTTISYHEFTIEKPYQNSNLYMHYYLNADPTVANEKAYPGCISPRELKKRARQSLEHQFITPHLNTNTLKQGAQTQIAHVITYLDSELSYYTIGGAKTYWEIVDPKDRAGYLKVRLSRITNLAMFKHLIKWEENSLNIVCNSGKVYAEESSGWKKTTYERFFEVNQNIADRIVYGTINFLTPDPTNSYFGAFQSLPPQLGALSYYGWKTTTVGGAIVTKFEQKSLEASRRLGSAISNFAANIVRRPPQPIVNLTNRVYDEAEYGFSTWTRAELSEPLKYFHDPMLGGKNPLSRIGVKRFTSAEEKIETGHAAGIFREVTNELKQAGKRYGVTNRQAFLKFKKQVKTIFVQVNQDILENYRLLEELHKKTAGILGIDSKDLPRGQLVHIATARYPNSVAFTTFGVNPDESLYVINGYRTDWLANTRFFQKTRDWLKYKESTLTQSLPMRLPIYSPRLLKDSNFTNLYPQWLVELYANRWTQLKKGPMLYPRLDEKFLNDLGEIIFERVARRGQDPVKALYKIGNSEDEMGLTVLRNIFPDTWVKEPSGRYPLEDKIFLTVSKYRKVFDETIKYQQSSPGDREFYLQNPEFNMLKKLNEEAKKAAQEVFDIAKTL